MLEDVGKLEVPVHDLGLDEVPEGVEDLEEELNGLLLGEQFFGLDVLRQVALITVLEDEVEVITGLFNVI